MLVEAATAELVEPPVPVTPATGQRMTKPVSTQETFGRVLVDLSRDPGWEGRGNRTRFVERDFQRQDFGYSATNWAGERAGGRARRARVKLNVVKSFS
jgi:hypothetical protein